MKLGLIGTGKMGSQIATRLMQANHTVIVTDINPVSVAALKQAGAIAAMSRNDLVTKLGAKPTIWLMIPSGEVDREINALLKLVPAGTTIIDGGNSHYELTVKRAKRCQIKGVQLIDVGVSGGVLGLEKGFAIMAGGDKKAYRHVEPLLKVLARPEGYGYFGPAGAGHYVKMIHNGIEYGMMEAYAEGYHLLRSGPFKKLDLAKAAHIWQHGSIIESLLNALIEDIMTTNPSLKGVDGYVANLGEGRWTVETARKLGIDAPAIKSALKVRIDSEKGKISFTTKLLAAMRTAFGGHPINKS